MQIVLLTALVTSGAGGPAIDCVDHSQPGWRVTTDCVDLFITKHGGHMAPVVFYRNTGRPAQPYHISPWQGEGLRDISPPVLVPLRGDFFCMPFGSNAATVDGEKHTLHGESASAPWQFVSCRKEGHVTTLELKMATTVRRGTITKKIRLVDGQNVVYTTHTLAGYTGRMPIAHHATLAVPEEKGSLRVATSPFVVGMTRPEPAGKAQAGNRPRLAPNQTFTDLARVAALPADVGPVDCTRFPGREGLEDLIQVLKSPTAGPAWMAVTCPSRGYLWFSLKDAAVLPGTVFWIANRGAKTPPWNGRNRCLGLEDTCSYFADGLASSLRPNVITKAGFPTAVALSPTKPTVINYIQGVARIPPDFETVTAAEFGPGSATFVSQAGKRITVHVNHDRLSIAAP